LYTLYFDLAGDQRGGTNNVFVNVMGANSGSYSNQVYTMFSFDPFTTKALPFFLSSPDAAIQFSFADQGNDNVGALLDNVRLDQFVDQQPPTGVPEPMTLSLLGSGIVGLVIRRRRANA
jgi:hypothetical protein